MQVVILCGGQGTRLKSRVGDLPKPMVEIGGRPLLMHQIELARSHGCTEIVLMLGYGAAVIREFFGDGSQFGVRIQYVVEDTPLGTAGGLLAVVSTLEERFVVMYGDVMMNVDLRRFWNAHLQAGAAVSILAHPNDHPKDSDLIEVDRSGRIRAFHPYPHNGGRYYSNLANAALYVIDRDALRPWQGQRRCDFVKDIFPEMLAAGALLYAYRSREYIKDAGTPERLDRVVADYEAGRIQRESFETPAPAVFLDRDGTLNVEMNRVKHPDQFHLIDGVAGAIRRLNRVGYRTVMISNQPVVARGDCTEEQLQQIHNKMETLLGEEGAFLDAIYYCPHHPDKGFAGERPELKGPCQCRKPATDMISTAVRDLNLDLSRSWLIGDSTVDVQTAANAGVKSVLVRTGHGGTDGRHKTVPDFVCSNLSAAVDLILSERTAGDSAQAVHR